MSEQNKNLRVNFTNHTNRISGGVGSSNNNEFIYFGVEKGKQILRRFKLLLRTGKQISVPYAFLPIIILEHDGLVYIRTNDLNITIEGRGLKPLEEYLSHEKVRWIKEFTSGRDDQETEVFISSILIEGDLII